MSSTTTSTITTTLTTTTPSTNPTTRQRNRRAPVGWQGRAWVLNDNEDDNEDDDDDDDNSDNNLTTATSRHQLHDTDPIQYRHRDTDFMTPTLRH
ncbi:hypothetical protein BP00DRAFT_201040 [Aspergillus indologenus CBS 114.80]|uniref:Uncharacterized protein n=1 Tax=Aspergillus indologenus CBS 114.80 TaxID=1450541 RepID=A0A2V5I170_9EURO|nr:hypothetical protein BP00DRAFT_201040 [Aspergillus indologenus CBS 114.80]